MKVGTRENSRWGGSISDCRVRIVHLWCRMRFVEHKREGKWKWDGHWFAEGHVGRYVFFGANLAPLALTSIGLQHSSKPNYDVAGVMWLGLSPPPGVLPEPPYALPRWMALELEPSR